MPSITIGDRRLSSVDPVYIIAELSANHRQRYEEAEALVHAAADAGADAVKLQTYTPETMTTRPDSVNPEECRGTLWEGRSLYDLYTEAFTPWDWVPDLARYAAGLGIDLFSTPFDTASVDFLDSINVPAFKIASFELVDLPLIRYAGGRGKPMIMSTGMASLGEITAALEAANEAGSCEVALLKCTSAYPAPPSEMHLRTIPNMAETFGVPVGISDHTLGIAVPIAAVTLGACIVEKHLTLSRDVSTPDSAFSLEPAEFGELVRSVRTVEEALGTVNYRPTGSEAACRRLRRSLHVVKDMREGDIFTTENIKSLRPGNGLAPQFLPLILGRRSRGSISAGTPLTTDHF